MLEVTLHVVLSSVVATIIIVIIDIVQDWRLSRTMGRFHNPSDSGTDMQLGDSVAEVMNANRSPEPHRTVAWEPEPKFEHTDGYPVGGNMDDIVARLREMLDGPVPYTVEPQDLRDAIAEIERLRECLQHAIDHVGKWQLFTAEEKQRVLAEYEQAVRGE